MQSFNNNNDMWDNDPYIFTPPSPTSPPKKKNQVIPIVIAAVLAVALLPTSILLFRGGRQSAKNTQYTPSVTVNTPAGSNNSGSTNSCNHYYSNATCTEPQHCIYCNTVNGSALGHDWISATTSTPMTCSRCGITSGEPLSNTQQAASRSGRYYENNVECFSQTEADELFPGIQRSICVPVDITVVSPREVKIGSSMMRRYSFHIYDDGGIHYYSKTPNHHTTVTMVGEYIDPYGTPGKSHYLVKDSTGYYWIGDGALR